MLEGAEPGISTGMRGAASLVLIRPWDKRAKARYRGTVSNDPAREVPS